MPDLIQNVCFECRKVFKKPEVPYYFEVKLNERKFYTCPDCGKEMQYMDKNFKAPPKKDTKKWESINKSVEIDCTWPPKK